MEDLKFGIIIGKKIQGGYKKLKICSCGQHSWGVQDNCPNCGNINFTDMGLFYRYNPDKKIIIPALTLIGKDDKGFKVKRINLSVVYNGLELRAIKQNLERTFEFNIVEKSMKIYKGDILESDSSNMVEWARVGKLFFRGINTKMFTDIVSTETNKSLIDCARTLSPDGYRESGNSLHLGFKELIGDYHYLETLQSCGFRYVNNYIMRLSSRNTINTKATRPHEILGLPKYMVKHIKNQYLSSQALQNLQQLKDFKNHNLMNEVMGVVEDESNINDFGLSVNELIELHREHYSNFKKLTLYIFRETKLNQGISKPMEAITLLKDYINMSLGLGVEFEKYPKSLKKQHDLTMMNFNLVNNNEGEKSRKIFEVVTSQKSYKDLEYTKKNEKYSIISPSSPDDLIKEGNRLSHCVASYVQDVNKGKCKVLFLREKDSIETPLVTIEVRGTRIRQIQGGVGNKNVSNEQRAFISKWAEERDLIEQYY